jgi:hypothetical protein
MKKTLQHLSRATILSRAERKAVSGGTTQGFIFCIFDCHIYTSYASCVKFCEEGACERREWCWLEF